MNFFEEYLHSTDPEVIKRAENWRIAIGLQDVDGLSVSDFLIDTARRNIEGEITIEEARSIIHKHYNDKKEAAREYTSYTIVSPDDKTKADNMGRPI